MSVVLTLDEKLGVNSLGSSLAFRSAFLMSREISLSLLAEPAEMSWQNWFILVLGTSYLNTQ